ncbi:MAG: zf-HC2 protein [Bacteroidetes bacterium]|nr:zf-HC2 protein [Bacteroidota bacterium]
MQEIPTGTDRENEEYVEMLDRHNHWTEDQSLLERFVLGHVLKAERNDLEDHLRVCEICQRAVMREQQFVVGIRRAGAEELKQRLKARVGVPARGDIPWPRILSLAAMIVIVVGVGVYTDWFGLRRQDQDPVSDQVSATSSPQSEGRGQMTGEEAKDGRPKDVVRHDEPSQTRSAGEAGANDKRSDAMDEVGRNVAEAGKKANDVYADREKSDLAIVGAEKQKNELAAVAQGGMDAAYQAEWVSGTILPSMSESTTKRIAEEQDARESRQFKSLSKKNAAAQTSKVAAQTFNGLAIGLSQQPSAALPLSQQNARRQRSIETQIYAANQTLNLTLFLDSLVDESELRNAVVEQVGEDSLIVHVANQRIGYRIPATVNVQTRAR